MINSFFGVGNVGKEPTLKISQNGVKWAEFSMCINDIGKDKATKNNWIRVKAFNGTADFVNNYVHKGDKVFIHAKISTWDMRDNVGEITKSGLDFIIQNIEIMSRHQDTQPQNVEPLSTQTTQQAPSLDITSDDLPF